jgi:hypothetical protein
MATEHWHVEKNIPLALILTFGGAIGLQSVAAVWWAAGVNARVLQIEDAIRSSVLNGERLTRVEVKVDWLVSASQRVQAPVTPDPLKHR